jgi:hypothetical protein
LILGTSKDYRTITVGQWNTAITGVYYLANLGLKAGDKIVVRTYLNAIGQTYGGRVRLTIFKEVDGSFLSPTGNIISGGTEGYSSLIYTIPSGYDRLRVDIHNEYTAEPNSHPINYKELKLEKGDKATDWTPALEDVQAAIDLKANIASPTFTGTVTAPTFIGALSGNASSASKLQTARTLWGQSFDGTGNISGDLTNVGRIDTSGSVSVVYGITGKPAWNNYTLELRSNGNDTVSLEFHRIGYTSAQIYSDNGSIAFGTSSGTERVRIDIGGNVGIGTTSPAYKLDVSGTGRFTDTVTAPTFSGSLSGNASTATKVSTIVTGTNTAELVRGAMADNDYFRILIGGTASNAGYVEIATADDGTEPIYVRQYKGVFANLVRTATLLDGSGNTTFPGSVTATSFLGNASTATALTSNAGSNTNPIYFSGGKPTASSYSFGNASGNIPISNGTLNSNLNADLLDGLHGYYFQQRDALQGGQVLYTTEGIWNDVMPTGSPYNVGKSTTSRVSTYSDYIRVERGDTIYWEVWAMQPGTTVRAYMGIERFDKDLKPITSNSGTVYGGLVNTLLPTTWTKFVGSNVLPTSHTPYNGSDGLEVRFIRLRFLHNYNTSGQSYYSGLKIYKKKGIYAETATILETARTINGVSFDGSANITTSYWGTARTLTIGNTGKSVNGSGNVAWSLAEIGALPLTGGALTGNLMVKGTNGISSSSSIHLGIGDSDTGFKWISDGVMQMYANNTAIGQ